MSARAILSIVVSSLMLYGIWFLGYVHIP